jgi:hypothetical protein
MMIRARHVASKILLGKPEVKRPLGMPNIKMFLHIKKGIEERMGGVGLDS